MSGWRRRCKASRRGISPLASRSYHRAISARILLSLVLSGAASSFPLGAERTVFQYREVFGGAAWVGRYELLSSGSGLELVYTGGPSTHRFSLGLDLDNRSWSWEGANGSAHAERRGAKVLVEGVLRGKPRKTEKDLGEVPWYQSLDYSIASLASSSKGSKRVFWMIQLEDLSFRLMCVRNAGPDRFDLEGADEPATKLVLSVSGVPESLWRNEYWYSAEGLYLGFRGKRGGLFAPAGTLSLISKEICP